MAKTMLVFLVRLVTLFSFVYSNSDGPRVNTSLGSIKGYHKVSDYGQIYDAYEGIPYAQPPVKENRFEPPKPVAAWSDELQATKLPQECLQYDHKPYFVQIDRVKGSEDCLYLNIYVPDQGYSNLSLPVMVWIHGGALTHGSGNNFTEKYFIDKDTIVVTINYRVGPLGFLSTEDNVVPGNMGFKDQSLAIRWVHENIKYFRGDPKRVTLVGQSAGGVSVHYHYLSPLSVGLFSRGISLSGTALNCWAQTKNALEKAQKLGALMGCPTVNNKEMIECLKNSSARSIVESVKEFMPWLYNPFTPFGPVVEKGGDKPFISRPPIEILESGDFLDAPWITSVTSDEGLYPVAEFALNETLMAELDKEWECLAPNLLYFNHTISETSQDMMALKIRQHYLGHRPINLKNIRAIIQMFGDRLFVADAEQAARMQAKANRSPVWFYYYNYRATTSLTELLSGTKTNFGVSHADDILFLIENNFVQSTATEKDREMQDDIIFLLATFADNGRQILTPFWKRVDSADDYFHYLEISGPVTFQMTNSSNLGDKIFWERIKKNLNLTLPVKDEL